MNIKKASTALSHNEKASPIIHNCYIFGLKQGTPKKINALPRQNSGRALWTTLAKLSGGILG